MSASGTITVVALDRETIERIPIDQFTDDIARNIHEPEAIAARYGLTPDQAVAFCARPEITKLLRLKRSIWESDGNIPERFRTYCQVGLLEASPKILSMLQDDSVLPAVRVDLVKTLTKVCGMEPAPIRQGDFAPAPSGPTFSVNIMFSGRTETISTTVIEPEEED
jgi:hypothetical protein